LDGKIWALKANSLTSPLIVTVTVTERMLFVGDKAKSSRWH